MRWQCLRTTQQVPVGHPVLTSCVISTVVQHSTWSARGRRSLCTVHGSLGQALLCIIPALTRSMLS